MTDSTELQHQIKAHIEAIRNAGGIYGLFRLLGYPSQTGKLFDPTYLKKPKDFGFAKEEGEKVVRIFTVMSIDRLNVFLIEVRTLASRPLLRYLVKIFSEMYPRCLLIFTVDYKEIHFIFPDYEKKDIGKHKLKTTTLTIKQTDIYRTDLLVLSSLFLNDSGLDWRSIWRQWKGSFNVQRVTERFFDDYKQVFFRVKKNLKNQKIETKNSHEWTLQFLNRIMFIYFIAKKGWLNETPKFMKNYWETYKRVSKYGNDDFYDKWLRPLFFEAFNNQHHYRPELPEDVNKFFASCPYLNGGLFTRRNDTDDLPIKITDALIKEVVEFFEGYNFTIKEDSVVDIEVNVDPQMIGYVYESLANISEDLYEKEDDVRGDWGIFYTAKLEVDFMCRRSIVEYLARHLDLPKDELYEFVFEEEKEKIEKKFNQRKSWKKIEDVLDNLSVVDPACGSGAFLVGMLNVLVELYRVVYKHTESSLQDFEMKYRIIQRSLYGVDVMPWAIHAAELRLWLQLIVETVFSKDELRKHPLLPNLSMNLRIGDSLVQEIGGISFNVRDNNLKIPLKRKLEDLKQEKRKYFENSPSAKFKTPEEFKAEEIRLFEYVLDERILSLQMDIDVLTHVRKERGKQTGLFDSNLNLDAKNIMKENKTDAQLQDKIQRAEEEITTLEKVKVVLHNPEKKPFVWDIDFAEVFSDKGGFDIVIGNPPYVRYQKIMPPNTTKSELSPARNAEYKEKLMRSVCNRFKVIQKLNKKSDLYIYFYFHGLSLLNSDGVLCFISSNSWLDVEYGKELQEFLIKYTPIIGIYDNETKRSFEHADVNTIIALLGAAIIPLQRNLTEFSDSNNHVSAKQYPSMKYVSKFIMFRKPFEEVINASTLNHIEKIDSLIHSEQYRVTPISQDLLWSEGLDEKKSYKGTMWGGRYLRSPDIFIDTQIKSAQKLMRLKQMINVETYLNTLGNDDFFFVTVMAQDEAYSTIKSRISEDEFKVENSFLTPFVESPKELNALTINGPFKTHLFRIPESISRSELKESQAYHYIVCGKNKGYKTELPKQAYDGRIMAMACYQGASHMIFYNPKRVITHRFFRIIPKDTSINIKKFVLLMNSTFVSLSMESFRNPSLGGGVLAHGTYTLGEFLIPKMDTLKIDIEKFEDFLTRKIGTIFNECGIDPSKSIREQEPKPPADRAALDRLIFDDLGLTKDECNEVYWAVCELVQQRLNKAKSLDVD